MKEITDQDFDREVLKCELPVLVCFTTRWCHNCYPTCLFTEELVSKYDGRVKFVKVDKEESPEVSDRYHVTVVPTILIFRDSQPVKKRLGFQDRRSLRPLLDSATAGEVVP